MLESKIVFYGEPLQPSTISIYLLISKLKRNQPHLFILNKWKGKQKNLKSDSHLAKVCFYLLQWKALKNDEQWFLWLLTWNNGEQWWTILFVLEIFTLLSWLYHYVEKQFVKKAMVNFNFMTSQTGQYMITIHILPNMSRSISCLNQAMGLSQLID